MWTPAVLNFDFIGAVDSFKFELYLAVDNTHLHGVQLAAGSLPKVGNTYTFDMAVHGFGPNGTIPDHTDLYMTVQAILGIDSGPAVESDIFQFIQFVGAPFNLMFS